LHKDARLFRAPARIGALRSSLQKTFAWDDKQTALRPACHNVFKEKIRS